MTVPAALALWAVAIVVAAPMAVVAGQCLVGVLTRRPKAQRVAARPSCAVLIPAHDEEGVIGRTLASVIPQVRSGDRVLVVADNCSDGTAAEARAAGAEVLERNDPARRGKGYALAAGVAHLLASPRAVVVMIDADCGVDPAAIDALVAQASATGRAAQAVFLMYPPRGEGGPSVKNVVSAFAFMVKNLARPMGMHRFGLPVPLTGSGMAFPWGVIRDAKLASGDIVEDLSLGIDLELAGHGARLCPQAQVASWLPTGEAAAARQRTRWEHGYLGVLLSRAPRLALTAARRRKPKLLVAAIDLAVPPLSLLVVLGVAALALCLAGGWLISVWLPAALIAVAFVALSVGLAAAWWRYGRSYLPARAMATVPLYVAWKLPIYLSFVRKRERAWIRTEREPGGAPPAGPAAVEPSPTAAAARSGR